MTRLSDSPLRVDVPVLHAAPFHLRLARCWPKRTAVLLSTQAVGELPRADVHAHVGARNVCFACCKLREPPKANSWLSPWMVDGPLGRRDASAPSPRDEISSPSKHARRRANAAVSLPQLAAPPPPPPPPRTPPLEAVAEGDIHLSVALPTPGGDGEGSTTYLPTDHAARRAGQVEGVARQKSMKTARLAAAAQAHTG